MRTGEHFNKTMMMQNLSRLKDTDFWYLFEAYKKLPEEERDNINDLINVMCHAISGRVDKKGKKISFGPCAALMVLGTIGIFIVGEEDRLCNRQSYREVYNLLQNQPELVSLKLSSTQT